MNKKHKKLSDGSCCFCGEDDYDLLDLHRIKPGSEGGRYTEHNTLTVCATCHRKIHAGRIQTYRKYYSTSGTYILHCEVDGKELWINP